MAVDLYTAVIFGVTAVPIFGTVAGWLAENISRDRSCPACKHPEHFPWCRVEMETGEMCWCDLFTEPEV